jgi:hypothetical protein
LGSKFVTPFDVEGNEQVREYLRAYVTTGGVYAFEIGATSFTPQKPIHLTAYGLTETFRLLKVTLFDR